MEKENRIFTQLKTHLEEVRKKLLNFGNKRTWKNVIMTKDKCRSYTTMKNLLGSLITKTIAGKERDDDVVSILDEQTLPSTEIINLDNFIKSEEYLFEAKNLSKEPLNLNRLLQSLTVFQEFLGDILHSVCHISSYKMKFPSGILVKDILEVNNQYLSIWEIIRSFFMEDKLNNQSSETGPEKLQTEIICVQKSLLSCLKEMSKVKLHIENYLKQNLIEIQLLETVIESKSEHFKLCGSETIEEFMSNNQINIHKLKEIEPSVLNGNSIGTQKDKEVCEPPDTLFPEAFYEPSNFENIFNIYSFPHKFGSQDSCGGCSIPESPCGDFFTEQVICPTDYLFLDPTAIYCHPKTNAQKRNSLPKIYSVDSVINEENNTEHPKKKMSLSQNIHCTQEATLNVPTLEQENNHQNTANTIFSDQSYIEEDLFPEDEDLFSCSNNQSQQYLIGLNEKMPSLIHILKSNHRYKDIDDIFPVDPLKNQFNVRSSSKQFIDISSSKLIDELKCNDLQNSTTYVPTSEDYLNCLSKQMEINQLSSQLKKVCEDKHKNQIERKVNSFRTQPERITHCKSGKEGMEEDVIYNKESLIELFHTADDHRSNAGSLPEEDNKFNMWPVTAEYIHVSREQRQNECNSSSSNESFPLSKFKSFEKSFFSLQMKRRYEQKQVYEGDLLVLQNPEHLVQQEKYTKFKDQKGKFKKAEQAECSFNKIFVNKELAGAGKTKAKALEKINMKLKNEFHGKPGQVVNCNNCSPKLRIQNHHFSRENFNFFKPNNYENYNNWNSFISVFTSNISPQTRINHHRMFRKVINTYETESLTCNILGNVHTLTSYGGPFRLFDVNGYPLTDSSGNVLKDPYGKSVVILDSTGLPQDDTKVFDAAGNSPKDIKFDPTQKPKTNSIIIKLTDNFKRPLRLFDKYGRPLTDSFGKLLVNIHGRPLLRFDNFGRPSTDYRGGPLYTDNGQRWSYKTTELLSSEPNSTETLPSSVNHHMVAGKELEETLCEKTLVKERDGDNKNNYGEENEQSHLYEAKISFLDKSSEIWARVETVLQQIPKRKPTEPKGSKTNVIINSVTVSQHQNPLEKEMLNSIIYHDSIYHHKDIKSPTPPNVQTSGAGDNMYRGQRCALCLDETIPVAEKYEPKVTTNNVSLKNDKYCFYEKDNIIPSTNHTNCLNPRKKVCSVCLVGLCNKPYSQPIPLLQNETVKTNHYYFNPPVPSIQQDLLLRNTLTQPFETILRDKNTCWEKPFLLKDDKSNSQNESTRPTVGSYPNSYPISSVLNTPSYFTFKNHDYLNNLCNQILKQQLSYQDKIKASVRQELMETSKNVTEMSFSPFTSSKESKFTTDLGTRTESLLNTSDTCRKISRVINNLKNYDNRKNHQDVLMNTVRQDQSMGDFCRDRKVIESVISYNDKDYYQRKPQNRKLQFSSDENAVAVSVLNEEDKHYEIKVTEIPDKVFKPKIGLNLFSLRKNPVLIPNFNQRSKPVESKKHCGEEEDCENDFYKKKMRDKTKYSPFRFPSDEKIYSTLTDNRSSEDKKCKSDSNISRANEDFKRTLNQDQNYCQGSYPEKDRNKNCLKTSRVSEKNKDSKSANKGKSLNFKNSLKKDLPTMKKQSSPTNRECNFVSFFGSPVKYVMNKLDSKRLSKPSNNNQMAGLIKKNDRDTHTVIVTKKWSQKVCETNEDELNKTVKTLYDINKSNTRGLITSDEKNDTNTNKGKYKTSVTNFHSKSCINLIDESKFAEKSYSGKDNPQNETTEKIHKDLPSQNTKLHRSFSSSSYTSPETYEVFNRSCYSYKARKPKQYPCNSNGYKRKSKTPNYSTEKSSKITKHIQQKSPFFAKSKKKTAKNKEISLFKKVEPEGKYMLKIKNRKRES